MKRAAPFLASFLVLGCSVVWSFGLLLAMNGVSESAGTLALIAYAAFALVAIVAAFGIAWRVAARASTDAKAVLSSVLIAAIVCVVLVLMSVCAVSVAASAMQR